MVAHRQLGLWIGVLAVLLLFTVRVQGQSYSRGHLGIGPMIGDPTGISVKIWQSANKAYQFGGAWSFIGEGAVHLHGDFLLHNRAVLGPEAQGVAVYYGLGIRLKAERQFRAGFRIPLGIVFEFREAPLDFFIEIAPIMDFIPATQLRMNGGFGIRYFFISP